MTDKAKAPRIKEQFKDDASEVEKLTRQASELQRRELQAKEMKIVNNPKKGEERDAGQL